MGRIEKTNTTTPDVVAIAPAGIGFGQSDMGLVVVYTAKPCSCPSGHDTTVVIGQDTHSTAQYTAVLISVAREMFGQAAFDAALNQASSEVKQVLN